MIPSHDNFKSSSALEFKEFQLLFLSLEVCYPSMYDIKKSNFMQNRWIFCFAWNLLVNSQGLSKKPLKLSFCSLCICCSGWTFLSVLEKSYKNNGHVFWLTNTTTMNIFLMMIISKRNKETRSISAQSKPKSWALSSEICHTCSLYLKDWKDVFFWRNSSVHHSGQRRRRRHSLHVVPMAERQSVITFEFGAI